MGESSACLARSFSQPSPTSSEEKGNPLQRALTTSISFGRFMSESLDWEKWSAFTHNRYLEEVEKYSRPGSVAEKKAYFEAHFKRRRAAALLEQQNAAANNFSVANMQNNVEAENLNEVEVQNIDQDPPVDQDGSYDASVEGTPENGQPGGIEKVVEPTISVEGLVESTNHFGNDECVSAIMSKNEDKSCNKDDSTITNLESESGKQLEVSSSKLSTNGSASKGAPSVKPILPVQLRNSEKSPDSKSSRRESGNKRRSYTTSLHMSINFASCSGETQNPTSPGLPKIANSRIIRAPAKKYKNSMVSQTSTRASVNSIFKHHLTTPPAENKRTITSHGDSISGSRTVDGKVQSPFTNYSKSSNTLGSKARLPTVTSSFTFKSEERAEKRKEFFQKLKQKSKSKEAEKQKPHTKSQVKPSSFIELRNSIALKATKSAEVPPKVELPNNTPKKIPPVKIACTKVEERAPFKVQNYIDSRPPWRLSMKMEWSKDVSGKNNRPPLSSTKGFSRKSMSENASPNVQI